MQYTPYDPYGRYTHTFYKAYTQPLHRYIVLPPDDCIEPYMRWVEPAEPPLEQFMADVQISAGDVLELFTLDKRVVFQGVSIEVLFPVTGTSVTPVMNAQVPFDTVDCGTKQKTTYLPFGGKLDRSTNLTDKQFIIDNPDFFGLRFDSIAADISALVLQITLVVNEQFDATLPTNAKWVEA